ncbi:MAG: Crp/Fnr family transcriptional regulator, partial [Sphingobacterium sp.]
MTIDQILDQIYGMHTESKNRLMNCITTVAFRKGHILMKADRVEKSIYFIKKGIVRAFAPLADQEITFWFGEEGETILSMK